MPSEPMRPPFSASNSWVISRARGLIGYDTYRVEKWLSEIENGDAVENDGDHSEMDYPHHHPAGELEDYDPDCVPISRMSIIEKLEAIAEKMEAESHDDEDDEPEPSRKRWRGISFWPSSSAARYNPLPSNPPEEGKPLMSDSQDANSEPTTGPETPYPNSDYRYPYFTSLMSPKFWAPKRARPSTPAAIPSKKPHSQFLSVPNSVCGTRRSGTNWERNYANLDTVSELRAHAAETRRCPSPFPSVRLPSTSSQMSPLFPPIADSEEEDSDYAAETLRVHVSADVGGARTPLPEIVRPGLQRAGRLVVPPAQFVASPFVPRRVGEAPLVVLEEQEEEEGEM
ncbi:hypothetical protein GQX73_g10226 [Xylaria multiplex]|uniref:Uncharacterized protein n=1 Tax=Xylaria multiplex TaxID=323545 RepID=A0A7C8MIR2_9PEZI|nr:hypothetical protein GQX73_g10226 [Xylaria multiplex]